MGLHLNGLIFFSFNTSENYSAVLQTCLLCRLQFRYKCRGPSFFSKKKNQEFLQLVYLFKHYNAKNHDIHKIEMDFDEFLGGLIYIRPF